MIASGHPGGLHDHLPRLLQRGGEPAPGAGRQQEQDGGGQEGEVTAVIVELMHSDHPLCSSRQPDQGKPSNNPTKKSHLRTVRVRVRVLRKENFLADVDV